MQRTKYVLLFCILLDYPAVASAQKMQIPIGVVGPLSGESQYGGKAHKNGIALAIDKSSNDKFDIRPIYRDDKGDPKTSESVVRDLINNAN